MPAVQSGHGFDEMSRQWHDLARRRLDYFTELYRSGRWRRYYPSEQDFAARMLDVIKAEKDWARLAGIAAAARPASPPPLRSAA